MMSRELTDEEYLKICKEDKRWWECERKRKFQSEKAALHHLQEIKQNYTPNSETMHAYDCRYCDGWHVGTSKKIKQQRIQVLSTETIQQLETLKQRLQHD
jgi:hypothetical protein